MVELNTFSIAARCARTGQLGVAVATALPAVGAICPRIRAHVGAISTQAWVNPYLAIDGLELLAAGVAAPDALARLIAGDPAAANRQLGMVDAAGRAAAHTGEACTPWAGHETAPGVAVQGNMLTGPAPLEAMMSAFRAAEDADLDERLMAALVAADAVGGDMRGKQSAALQVFADDAYALVDLRVDEHADPVGELRRILEISRLQLMPYRRCMPTRDDAARPLPPEVVATVRKPPPDRPGGGGSRQP